MRKTLVAYFSASGTTADSGKKIVLFATSCGSGFGKAVAGLKPSVSANTEMVEGRILNSADALKRWVKEL